MRYPSNAPLLFTLLFGLLACTQKPPRVSQGTNSNVTMDGGETAPDAGAIDSGSVTNATDSGTTNTDAGNITVTVYDDCLLETPNGTIPQDLYTVNPVLSSSSFGIFKKATTIYGITLVAKDNVSDDFLRAVGQTIIEMFPQTVAKPSDQAEILRNLYAYKTVIPVFAGGESGIDEQAIRSIEGRFSICDIIMQGSEGQAMEVLEHILHHVTDIGLHAAFRDQWGMTNVSTLNRANAEAIAAGIYQTASYNDIDETHVRQRVILQEFAYWIVSSYWDLQTTYGPNEQEWTATTPTLLQMKAPTAYQLMEASIKDTMAAPSRSTLDGFTQWAH